MCRSTSQGGRRCPGRRTSTSTTPAAAPGAAFTTSTTPPTGGPATASEPAAVSEAAAGRAAFLRQHGYTGPVDGDGNPTATTTRTTDGLGRPLDEKSARFFALREAGYRGPLDQDSNPTGAHSDIFAALDRGTTRARHQDPSTGGKTSGGDRHLALQIGRVDGGRADAGSTGGTAGGQEQPDGDEPRPTFTNVAGRHLTVGHQVDTVPGDLHITMPTRSDRDEQDEQNGDAR